MEVLTGIEEVQIQATQWISEGKSIGLVPTMGYLHEGHERLIQEARKENDYVILSVFVNPLQFGESEDLDRYPRDEKHDQSVAKENGVDILFSPSAKEMYPTPLSMQLTVIRRADVLCGRSRPGHFEGVVTVLAKLFNICRPTRAYFGMKDAQQSAVVDALIDDFNYPVELVTVPTVREGDGLAKSSRNVNLTLEERKQAPFIQQALQYGRKMVVNGTRDSEVIINETRQFIESRTHGRIDYIELLSYPELEPVNMVNGQVILAIAVYYSRARLIDNVIFDESGEITKG